MGVGARRDLRLDLHAHLQHVFPYLVLDSLAYHLLLFLLLSLLCWMLLVLLFLSLLLCGHHNRIVLLFVI